MEEGKLPLNLLEKILNQPKLDFEGIIQGPKIGCDVAVVDYNVIMKNAQKFYNSKEKVYLVFKTDPITFPTPNPGKYAVIVNANDIVTSGAIPFGFNATIILPKGSKEEEVFQIQSGIQDTCNQMNIAVLGGHTEISSSVNTPIVSGAMIGMVPKDYYVPRKINVGDVMLCVDWCAKEGIGIIASEGYDKLLKHFDGQQLDKLKQLGEKISVVDDALQINKKYLPGLMHDATEGGILGAAYETIVPEGFGLELFEEKIPFTKETIEVCNLLEINSLRLISSGTLLVVTSREKAEKIKKETTTTRPIEIIGEITSKTKGVTLDGVKIEPPGPDAIIDALRKIEEGKF
jgi:hydrogenase expression/formation protein HypE